MERPGGAGQMKTDLDNGFKDVTGENLYLLTKKGTELSSNGPVGQKWVVTRTVDMRDDRSVGVFRPR